MASFEKKLATNIREARIRLGYTQTDLAQKIGVTTGCISQYERCWRMPNLRKMSAIAHVFDMSLDDLVPHVEESNELVNTKQTNIYDLIGE